MPEANVDLGAQVQAYRAAGGFTAFQNSPTGRALFLTIAGVAVGFIPGLMVTLITDFLPALLLFPVIGGAIAYVWARRQSQVAAVTEARVHERGVVLVDGRGTHPLAWGDVASIEGRLIENVISAPLVDVKGVTNHSYLVRTRDGTGFWLDDRIQNVAALAETVVRASGVIMTRMA
ncbi:MAG TPA: hypothetical protein VM451_01250 [Candidatus Limnocylindria bacterium]|nr:hypothetical protein [Candidatus Limnocylindria bacterium]